MSLVLHIPRRLESPNKSRGAHWRVRHRITQEWEQECSLAARRGPAAKASYDLLSALRDRRMLVTVERHVPSERNFIRDDDNLVYSTKPLRDALKRLGYIKDDSRKWLELPMPTQHVSEDGSDFTIVTIEPAGV